MSQLEKAMISGPIPFRSLVYDELRQIIKTPAYRFFGAVWSCAAAYLALTPSRQFVFIAGVLVALTVVHVLLTLKFVPLTSPTNEAQRIVDPPWRLWLQVAVLVLIVVLTGIDGMVFNRVIPEVSIPLWSPIVSSLRGWGQSYTPNPNFVINPVAYVGLPLILLLLLGARWRELGFSRGHYPWRMTVLWSFELLGAISVALTLGRVTILGMIRLMGSNALQNGFMEEFLWRGAIQTRFAKLISPDWGLVLSALGFGLWHLGLAVSMAKGDWFAGLAISIVMQGTAGLSFGYIFRRTRNLLAPSIVHILGNSIPL